MNKPTSNTRISWDDNATSLSSPPSHHIAVDSDVNDTTEEDEIDEFRIRSPGNRSPVTFYIESESSKNGFPYDTDDCTMTSVPGDTASGPTSIDMLSATSANEKYRRSSSPSYANFTTSGHKKAVTVGICAMEKKSLSKPMKEILTRLEEFEYIHTTIFPEAIILNEPVEKWPLCDCLIAFHSKGFPLEKAIEYTKLRKPYIINNLEMQYDIQDRRSVYKILEKEGIELPRHAIFDRSSPTENHLEEYDDHVEVNGTLFNKPFVEKPISAEDHNIYMYYPTSAGGGSQRLFRKIGSRSSVYSSESGVRKTGSYIYEDFMPTDGTDVKVYTVGPDYAHAEARKSPALDGKVERDSEGKEVRYPVILSNKEKLIARKVCLAFKQMVCGFDLLRANGKSIVCDVNGFSFVKNSSKYYDDSAKVLGNMILRELAPKLNIPWTMPFQLDDPPIVPTTVGKMMELRCVIGVIRHGDRTPKQKMKLEVKHPRFFELFKKYGGRTDDSVKGKGGDKNKSHIKLKRPQQLQEILDISRQLLEQIESGESEVIEEKKSKLEQIKTVLEMYGHFSGINRKVQLKYQPKGRPRNSSSDDDTPKDASLLLILKWGGELTPSGRIQAEELGRVFRCMYPGGQDLCFGGLPPYSRDTKYEKSNHTNPTVQKTNKPTATNNTACRSPHNGEYSGTQGLGLLRLHSTYRHDLKIYASDEGRVQMTAAAFAKGLLALEGEITPILVQMVKSANTNGLLDNESDCSSKYQNMVKAKLHEMMQTDKDFVPEDEYKLNPCQQISIANSLKFIQNPVRCCKHMHYLIQEVNKIIEKKRSENESKELYHAESWELLARRWSKLEKDFLNVKTNTFNISKVPDIYDCIKYDHLHNKTIFQCAEAEELYTHAKHMADVVIPQEYGMTRSEKLTIAQGICAPLLRKIRADLQRNVDPNSSTDGNGAENEAEDNENEGDHESTVNRLDPRYSSGVSSPGRHVRTRLYFTSESHIHSLLTIITEGGLVDVSENKDEQWKRAMEYVSLVSELNYMTQVVIMLYEDPTKDVSSDERFHVELHFSPGVNCCVQKELPPGPGFRPHSRSHCEGSEQVGDGMMQSKEIKAFGKDSFEDSILMEESASQPLPSENSENALFANETTYMRSDQRSQDSSVKNQSQCFGEMSDAPAPIICTAKCSSSALKDIFGNIHEEVEMDVGTDPLQKEDLKEFTNSQEEEPTKTEPITITRGRRRPSGKPCGDHEKGSGGSAPDAYPYAPKRSRSLDKRGSKSLDSTNDGKDGVSSRRMSTIGSISGTSGCNIDDPLSKSQSMEEVGDEELAFRVSNNYPQDNIIKSQLGLSSSAPSSSPIPNIMLTKFPTPPCPGPSTYNNLQDLISTNHPTSHNEMIISTSLPSEHVLSKWWDKYGLKPPNTNKESISKKADNASKTDYSFLKPSFDLKCRTKSNENLIDKNIGLISEESTISLQNIYSLSSTSLPALIDAPSKLDGFRRSHRHSIPGHRLSNYLKFLHELSAKGSSTVHLFSTAVISGSSSAPNLKEMPRPGDYTTLSVGMPMVRPLETLHNALSLRQLDAFLSFVTSANFKTPSSEYLPTTPFNKPKAPMSASINESNDENNTQQQSKHKRSIPPHTLGLTSQDSSFSLWNSPQSYLSSSESSPASTDAFHRIRNIHQIQGASMMSSINNSGSIEENNFECKRKFQKKS